MSVSNNFDDHNQDATLLGRVAQSDLIALELLFAEYQRQVFQLAFSITGNTETAEEILQDTFYQLYRHASQLDASRPLLPWLYRVATNLAYNRYRHRHLRGERLQVLSGRTDVSAWPSPEQIAEQRELQGVVHTIIEELSSSHRTVLILHYLYDYSVAEIATMLDCPEGTVKSRLYYARKLLKVRIQQRYGGAALLLDQI